MLVCVYVPTRQTAKHAIRCLLFCATTPLRLLRRRVVAVVGGAVVQPAALFIH